MIWINIDHRPRWHRFCRSGVLCVEHDCKVTKTYMLFREERALRAAAQMRDLAATAKDPDRKARFVRDAADLAVRIPQSDAERLLLILD